MAQYQQFQKRSFRSRFVRAISPALRASVPRPPALGAIANANMHSLLEEALNWNVRQNERLRTERLSLVVENTIFLTQIAGLESRTALAILVIHSFSDSLVNLRFKLLVQGRTASRG